MDTLFIIGFILGLFVGTSFGVVLMGRIVGRNRMDANYPAWLPEPREERTK